MSTIGFIGSGNMAEAIIKGIIGAELFSPSQVTVSDINAERLSYMQSVYGVMVAEDNCKLVENSDIVVLSVKPQTMADALADIKEAAGKDKLFISIAAGITIAFLVENLGDAAIVRVMPNTPALVGEGASALYANENAKPRLDEAKSIFDAIGKAVIVEKEQLIDAVTAVSGSGPAYYFLLMEEMIKTAVKLGLEENIAKDLVLQTAKGSAILAVEADKNNQSPAILRKKVTSPGGTTQAALKTFAAGGFGNLVETALKSACDRSKELSG